jgi:hypothetical protein
MQGFDNDLDMLLSANQLQAAGGEIIPDTNLCINVCVVEQLFYIDPLLGAVYTNAVTLNPAAASAFIVVAGQKWPVTRACWPTNSAT